MKDIIDNMFSLIRQICDDVERQRELEKRNFGGQCIARVFAQWNRKIDVNVKFFAKNLNPHDLSAHEEIEIAQIQNRISENAICLLQTLRTIPALDHDEVSASISVYMPREAPYLKLEIDRLHVGPGQSKGPIDSVKQDTRSLIELLHKIPVQFLSQSFRRFQVNGNFIVFAPSPEAAACKFKAAGQEVNRIFECLDHQDILRRLDIALSQS